MSFFIILVSSALLSYWISRGALLLQGPVDRINKRLNADLLLGRRVVRLVI